MIKHGDDLRAFSVSGHFGNVPISGQLSNAGNAVATARSLDR